MSETSRATDRSGRGRSQLGVAASGLVLALLGGVFWIRDGSSPPVDVDADGASGPGTSSEVSPTPPPARIAPWRPGAPRSLRIDRLGVRSPVQPIRTVDGTLVPPSDPTRLGWWADGARPGDRRGSVLVTGHTVHTGGGALDRLEELDPGDVVTVRTTRDSLDYAVDRIEIRNKGFVAEQAERLFSQEVPGRLVLITCEDWDGTRYLSNVVVTARPVT